jgi:TP901 family phage tail tape measure protein
MANSTQEAIRIAAEGIAKLKVEMTSLNAVILDGATKLNSMLSADTTSFKELSELLKKVELATRKTNEASEKKIVVDGKIKVQQNELARTYQSLNAQREKEIKEIQRANTARLREADAIERNKKALQRQKDALIELSRPFNQLIEQHKLAKKVLQDLTVTQGKNSRETKQAQKEYDRLTSRVNQANQATSNFANEGLISVGKGFVNLLGAFGIIGGFQLFANIIKDTFNRVREFDKSMQNLAGVFRTNREALKPLEATIISVAGASIKTSREVANLAETLATLGKSPEQIQKLLKPVVELGIGLNATGAEAGEFLIQMLNAFGASDDEAVKYADTIATIRTSTTLDFQKMRDSFQYIAPISRLLGKDLAYTGAVVGILADNGLKAQQAGRVLGTSLQKLAIKGLTLTQALEQINQAQREGVKETELLAMANSLLGAEGAKIGIVLARNSEIIDTNAEAIRNNGGALDDLVNQQLESLDAKLLVLDASWEELILSVENGTGVLSTAFKGFIDDLTIVIKQITRLNKTDNDWLDTIEAEAYNSKLKLISEEFENILRIGKQQGIITKENQDEKYLIYLNHELKKFEGRNDLIGDELQLLFKKRRELIEVKKQIDINGADVGRWMSKEIILNKEIEKLKPYEKQNSEVKGIIKAIKEMLLLKKDSNNLDKSEKNNRRELKDILKEIVDLQKQLKDSTKEESVGILNKIALLNEEKKAWEELSETKSKRPKAKSIDLPSTIGIDEKSFEFVGKTKKEIESILLIEQFRLEQLKGTGMAYVRQSEYIDTIKNLLEGIPDDKLILSPKNNEEADKLIKKLAELESLKDIFSEVTDTFSDMFDIDMSKFDFLFDGLENSVEDWAKLSKELIGSVLDASLQSYEIELQAAQVARDLTLNNDLATEEQKEAARAQFDEKERDIKTRQAKEERKNNLIKIAVDTAVGVALATANYLSNPLTAPALALVLPLIIGTGLAQAALVASQPLPKFEKGTQNAPQGMATTDEKGAEIHTDKLGNIKDLGSNQGARNKYLEKGDKIFTADQSKNMLEGFDANHLQRVIFDMNMISNGNILSEKAVDRSLLNKMDALASSNEMVWKEVKKLASRPINVNNKVEIKQDRAY